ncbi:17255_t:CDS:1 [Cetraspora pellucida]|uniref:17255_t:CDS:1 n=1 Tax=Cetraspora pellucida TaxID=1433469 RepID=A0A9N8VVV8_9GLOM|nr:17255_t:CDS:1 [Cetraspora pellucida]
MNNKIIKFVLALIFLLITIKDSTARSIPQSNVNPLLERGEKKCYDYVFATSTFCDDKFTGVMSFVYDDVSCTTSVYGMFSKGFVDTEKNCYDIVLNDPSGKTVYTLTGDLGLDFVDGGTKPFSTIISFDFFKFLSIDGKRKRQNGASVGINTNGQPSVSVPALPGKP